jgi:lysophospholipase L1-like esterase
MTEPKRKWIRYLQNFSLLGASCLAGLVMLELVLRWTMPQPVFHRDLWLLPLQNRTGYVDYGGTTHVVHHSTNKWGFRGGPVPNDWEQRPTILTVGGSTTQCVEVNDDETWPAQLQVLLRGTDSRIMVQNAGIAGHTSRGHVLMMERVVQVVKPDLVIVLLGINDLTLSLREDYVTKELVDRTSRKYTLFAHSRVAQMAYLWKQILVNKTPRVFRRNLEYSPTPLTDPTPLPNNLDDLLPSLPIFRQNVTRIIQLAKEQHVQLLFLTQPTVHENTPANEQISGGGWWIGETRFKISAATWRRMLDRFNSTLMEVCRAQDAPCFDLASAIPSRPEYIFDLVHFTPEGDRLVAQKVCQFMQHSDILDELVRKKKQTGYQP